MGLEIIEDETDRLSNMVEELLDFSKIINGIVKLNKDNCDLEVFIEYIETLMKARAIKEDKTFIVKGEKKQCSLLKSRSRSSKKTVRTKPTPVLPRFRLRF